MALWSCCSLARSVSEGSPRVPCPSLWSHSERSSDMAHMTGARSCITHLTGGCRLEASAEQTMVRYETSWTLGSSKRYLKVEKLSSSGHVALTSSCKMHYLLGERIAVIMLYLGLFGLTKLDLMSKASVDLYSCTFSFDVFPLDCLINGDTFYRC